MKGIKTQKTILIIFAMISMCTPSIAKDHGITLDGLARSASLFFELSNQCSDRFGINNDEDRRKFALFFKISFETSVEIGFKTFGAGFKSVLDRESERRKKEIEITGREKWCAYQRERMKTLRKDSRH